MRWVRTNRRWSTWLALAAMALQLVLSCGHIHLEQLASGAFTASMAAANALPSQQNPDQHPANEAGGFSLDAPPYQFALFNFIFVSPQRAAFQSRAPPLA